MSQQLIFNFPFKKTYLSQDFYVSKNNFNAFKLIESWPQWPSRFINIFGPNIFINLLGHLGQLSISLNALKLFFVI